jgi:hypothetical protein
MKNIVILLILVAFTACTPASNNVPPFVDPSFVKRDFITQGVTILPMGLASNVKDLNVPELRRYAGKAIYTTLRTDIRDIVLIPFEVTLEKLQDSQLSDGWLQAQNSFEQSGILRAETMDKITTATGTRYALYPYLQSFYIKEDRSSLSSSISKPTYYYASFSVIIWDKKSLKAVYEGTENGTSFSSIVVSGSGFDAVKNALENSIKKFLEYAK